MSYSSRPPPSTALNGGSNATRKLYRGDGVDGDCNYVNECRRIQELIRRVQTHTSTINKVCEASHPDGWKNGAHQKDIHEQISSAKNLAVETQARLRNFADITGGTAAEKSQRRLMHQKLFHNYQTTLKALEAAAERVVYLGPSGVGFRVEGQDEALSTTQSAFSSTSHSLWSNDSVLDGPSSRYPPVPLAEMYDSRPYDKTRLYPKQKEQPHNLSQSDRKYLGGGMNDSGGTYHRGNETLAGTERYVMPLILNSGELDQEMMRERHERIEQIQTDIQGIHDLYQEFSLQVCAQGNDLDNIEAQMMQAGSLTADATAEVQITQSYQRNRTRRLAVLVCASCLGIIVVCIFVYRTFVGGF